MALLFEVDESLRHGNFSGINLLNNFVYALANEELVGAHFADGASLRWFSSFWILGCMGVNLSLLHALAIIRVTAEAAKDHLASILKNVVAGRTLFGRLLLGILDRSLPEEDGILVRISVAAPAHHKRFAFFLQQN